MQLRLIESTSDLRKKATAWDDLWARSDSTMPTHRAELVAQWVEHFGRDQPFAALVVEHDGQFVAALPIIANRKYGLRIGKLTCNCWSDCGTLLLDSQSDTHAALQLLFEGEKQLGLPLLLFDGVDAESPAWKRWNTARSEHVAPTVKPKYRVGLIDITHDWDAYVVAWSANHRRAVKKLRKALSVAGDAELVTLNHLAADAVEPLLHQAFEIEDKGWKGREGTSVLRTPGAFDFFLRQVQQLCTWNQSELFFLHLNGQPIAFDFCYSCKGVLSSHKIGYDEQFRELGPFQMLRSMQLEQMFADPSRCLLNTLGILDEGKAKWCTRYVQSSRIFASTGSLLGNAAIAGYRHLWPRVRGWIRKPETQLPEVKPGAARLLEAQPRADTEAATEQVLAGV